MLDVEHEHHVEHHGLLVREALVAAKYVEHRLGHREALARGRHHQAVLVHRGHACGVRHGCRARPAAEKREGNVDLVLGRGVVRRGVEGVEQERRALQHVHDRVAVGGAREDGEVAIGQLTARVDARAEVVKLGRRGQVPRDDEIRHLLVAKAVLALRPGNQVLDVVATKDEVALVGHGHAILLGVAVDVRDGGETHEHAGAVGVAQAALHVIAAVEVAVQDVGVLVAVIEAVGDGGASQRLGGHGVGVRHVRHGGGVERREDGPEDLVPAAV